MHHATAGSFLGISGVVWFWVLTIVSIGAVVFSLSRRFQLLSAGRSEDRYSFRTPPLRNVAITGPWMHNSVRRGCSTISLRVFTTC